ncbi:MAG TPA: zinc dependent phospholipase C family protein, partial [Flavisolibacter sp.]|nr:zinc dependent phospholipase C family protein [Flavisolibacter sp.]
TEATKHFIDLEAYGEKAESTMPLKWEDAVAKYTKDTLLKYGHVPYWIITMKDRMAKAFDRGDRDSILFYAADLAHYIEDAHVPLHTTLNYDGQLTGQKGIHALWESVVPELNLTQYDLEGKKKAKYLKNPEEAIWKAIRHTYSLVPGVLGAEKEVTNAFTEETKYRIQKRNGRDVKSYTRNFALAYSKKLGSTINDQAIRAANLVADFWYTAWVDGGKPDLKAILARKLDTADEKKITDEIKAYRKNELLKKGWLVSRREAVSDSGE